MLNLEIPIFFSNPLAMLLVTVDRNDPEPVFRQISERIAEMIEGGVLAPGDRLPPTRVLAERSAVHRSTVVRAYEELRALGYVEGRPGSFTTVRRRSRWPRARAVDGQSPEDSAFSWDSTTMPVSEALRGHRALLPAPSTSISDPVDFESLSADPALAPSEDIRRCLNQIIRRSGGIALDYGDPAGWPPLREKVASRLSQHGVAVSPDEILITAGAQQALDLILRLLVKPGDAVAVEAPTYGKAHALFRLHQVTPLEVPMRPDGMDLDRLEEVLKRGKPRLVFTMPNFQNPTGITTDQPHRERLLDLSERFNVPLVEDGFEEEMKYFGQAVLPVKSMDDRGIVIYVGTFSKVVFPGLRIGWIAAAKGVIEPVTDLHHTTCLAGNTLAQAAAARFFEGSEYDLYLRRVHRAYRRRMKTMLEEMAAHIPAGCSWSEPEGGYSVWLSVPSCGVKEEELVRRCAEVGVLVSDGNRYFLRPQPTPHLRLSISKTDEHAIEEGCKRLGKVLEEMAVG